MEKFVPRQVGAGLSPNRRAGSNSRSPMTNSSKHHLRAGSNVSGKKLTAEEAIRGNVDIK